MASLFLQQQHEGGSFSAGGLPTRDVPAAPWQQLAVHHPQTGCARADCAALRARPTSPQRPPPLWRPPHCGSPGSADRAAPSGYNCAPCGSCAAPQGWPSAGAGRGSSAGAGHQVLLAPASAPAADVAAWSWVIEKEDAGCQPKTARLRGGKLGRDSCRILAALTFFLNIGRGPWCQHKFVIVPTTRCTRCFQQG